MMQGTKFDGWNRASNVQVQKVNVCPELRNWLKSAMAQTGMAPNLQYAVTGDALLNASLSRTSSGADRVFAVHRNGSQLTMFVY
jgi:hypothetical protein